MPLKSKLDRESSSAATTTTTTPNKSAIKQLPGKLAKKVKHQFRRLDGVLHHVIHPKQHRTPTFSITSPSSPIFYPVGVVRAYLPPDQSSASGSVDSRDTWDVKDSKHSLEPPNSLANHSIDRDSSSTIDIDMSDEHHFPQEEPQLNPHEHDLSASGPTIISPTLISPTVFIEPETPDPFLIDDEEEDSLSEEEAVEEETSSDANSQLVLPTEAVPLDIPSSPEASILRPQALLPNLQKDVPPPPSESEEEYVPELYVSALIVPTMFLPIPNTDPLTTLLNKYIYPPESRPARDITGEWQGNDFHTLVMTNSWRALARMARDRLVTSDPADLTLVLGLWHLRLSCLARLRLFNQTSAECTNLFAVLNAISPPDSREYVFERLLPFELEVMQTRLRYWAGDQMGYLDTLYALLKKCKMKCRQSGNDPTLVPMWKERGARVCLIIASQLVEMKEIPAAAKLLEPLCNQGDISSPALRSSVGRIYLQGGIIHSATKHFSLVAADPTATEDMKRMNAALLASAEGQWTEASDNLKAILEKDSENYVAVNNLSVALLSQGKLKEGIDILEKSLKASPSSLVVVEPFLFNLSTLYELRSTTGFEKKKELLVEVAKWSGDGLKTHCLKMPPN